MINQFYGYDLILFFLSVANIGVTSRLLVSNDWKLATKFRFGSKVVFARLTKLGRTQTFLARRILFTICLSGILWDIAAALPTGRYANEGAKNACSADQINGIEEFWWRIALELASEIFCLNGLFIAVNQFQRSLCPEVKYGCAHL